jgi:ATP-dependent RNA helicase SUPV3L1/SUV3
VGDIDALIARLAHIRTWTYVAYHADWLRDAAHWQERTRAVEDALSDALHDRLTQRFIDRRTQALLKGLQSGAQLAAVEDDGAILVEGHAVGRVEGLRYVLEPGAADAEARALSTAARRVLVPEIRRRAKLLIGAADEPFALAEPGVILWRSGGPASAAPVGRLLPGATALTPRLEPLLADSLSAPARAAVRQRLALWLDAHLAALTRPLRRLQAAGLEGPGRGLAFLLVEGLGNVRTPAARAVLNALGAADRARLTRLGLRFGVRHVYLPAMLKPRAIELRARLWSIHHRMPGLAPAPERPAFAASDLPPGFAEAIGYEAFGATCLRVDIVERLAARLRALARAGPFALPPELTALTGLSAADLGSVVEALGYGRNGDERYQRRRSRSPQGARRASQAKPSASPFAALRGIRLSG